MFVKNAVLKETDPGERRVALVRCSAMGKLTVKPQMVAFIALTGGTPWLGVPTLIAVYFGLARLFGILTTLPIGGADMPVLISVYTAFTRLAVGLAGYALQNPTLMIAGIGVWAVGLMLTLLRAKAMNRSVASILFKTFGATKTQRYGKVEGEPKPTAPADDGIRDGRQVITFQPDAISLEFSSAEVALVIGANDVVKPAARTDMSSPIARQVYVIGRGTGKGHASIVNALFYKGNCNAVYGDAAAILTEMTEAVRGLGKAAAEPARIIQGDTS
ncbi:MAG: NAD(P)(+) transhydrogenase (Re/Si-specific) subunit beta [Alphaproteobacteria bacterium]|nr:NAD(P)(+) transhydrogenase (Re/Si-specific) subunit beta [Alphaproteobacteria bacterium]